MAREMPDAQISERPVPDEYGWMRYPAVMVPVSIIGGWLHGTSTVREIAARRDFWSYADLTRRELTARIREAAGISPEHALEAAVLEAHALDLADGCHRWAVADALGLKSVPVTLLEIAGHPRPSDARWWTS